MENYKKNPSLIVKNGLYLFTRYILVMFIAFYTTRLTLQVLGVVDYGINNIVGGLISMFAIVSMPITGSLQRFFNVEFTKNKIDGNMVFNTSVRIIFILILVMFVLYESVGLYLVNYVLKYPIERQIAVNFVFHITAVMTLFSFAIIPFAALLYSKEKMGVPATVEFLFSLYKLFYLIAIPYISFDSLILYTIFLLIGFLTQFVFYYLYCIHHFSEVKIRKRYDKQLGTAILKFSGWNSIEAVAGLSITYLSNLIINFFGGVLYNTAYGLSQSLNSAVLSFTTNLIKAVEPQITSSTVLQDDNYRNQLLLTTIKLSVIGIGYILIFFIFDGDGFLKLWLGKVPNSTYSFCLVMLISSLFSSIILPLRSTILASGKIQRYFSYYGVISIISIVCMYSLLYLGLPLITAVIMIALCQFLVLNWAVITVCRVTSFSYGSILRSLFLALIPLLITCFVYAIMHSVLLPGMLSTIISIITSSCTLLLFVYYLGCTKDERTFAKTMLSRIKTIIQ